MAYCTSADLTGVGAPSDIDTTTIIASADREIDNYLRSKGATGTAGDPSLQEASIKLSKAGILEYGILSGKAIASSGEMLNGPDPNAASAVTSAIRMFRRDAYDILDRYAAATTATPYSTGFAIVHSHRMYRG